MSIGDQPAFPIVQKERNEHSGLQTQVTYPGLSVREWMVGMVASGICANINTYLGSKSLIAVNAIEISDAILAALEKES